MKELRKLAVAATPGPWIAGDDEDSDYYLVGPPSFDRVVTNPVVKLHATNDAEFIAAANPTVILQLLDRLEKAERDSKRWTDLWDLMSDEKGTVVFYGRLSTIDAELEIGDSGDLHDELAIAMEAK